MDPSEDVKDYGRCTDSLVLVLGDPACADNAQYVQVSGRPSNHHLSNTVHGVGISNSSGR